MITKISETQAKTILIKSGLPGSDWVVNPYNGCQFACMYCYAAQIARWHHSNDEWGSFLDVKINAPELLKKELEKLSRRDALRGVSNSSKDFGFIFFSSVTDPYTSLEAKYNLTRQCLEVLVDFGYEGQIGIQTKSPLVLKDIDVLKRLKNVQVGFTLTTLDDKVSRFLEVFAPPVTERIRAMKKLNQNGINTYAFIGPVLPHFVNNSVEINNLLDAIQDAGTSEVWFEHIHLVGPIKSRLFNFVKENTPDLISDFTQADTAEYRVRLEKVIRDCLRGRQLTLGLNKILFHRDLPQKK